MTDMFESISSISNSLDIVIGYWLLIGFIDKCLTTSTQHNTCLIKGLNSMHLEWKNKAECLVVKTTKFLLLTAEDTGNGLRDLNCCNPWTIATNGAVCLALMAASFELVYPCVSLLASVDASHDKTHSSTSTEICLFGIRSIVLIEQRLQRCILPNRSLGFHWNLRLPQELLPCNSPF